MPGKQNKSDLSFTYPWCNGYNRYSWKNIIKLVGANMGKVQKYKMSYT